MYSNRKKDRIIPKTSDANNRSEPKGISPPDITFGRSSSSGYRKFSLRSLRSSTHLLLHDRVYRKRLCSTVANVITRILTLCMNVLLLMLSICYCTAQLSTVHLKLLNECTPKTKEEIYHHSYLAGLQDDGNVTINAESQWGHTDRGCYTTKPFQMDTDRLWYSNVYEHEWKVEMNYKVVLFGFLVLYSMIILLYTLKTIITDVSHLRSNTLHTLSMQRSMDLSGILNPNRLQRFKTWMEKLLDKESTRWIIRMILFEIVEFGGAVLTMMLYNGYWWNDPDNEQDVYLAEKPHYIMLYAATIAFNMFGSAALWLSYAFVSAKCHGVTFRGCLFLVNDLSDLFYTIFPLIVVYTDEYTANNDDLMIFLGMLQLENRLAFLSAFGFMFLLCSKSLHLVYTASKELRNRHYFEFAIEEEPHVSWIAVDGRTMRIKQKFLAIVSSLYIAGGIAVLMKVFGHMSNAKSYCKSITESTFMINSEFGEQIKLSLEQQSAMDQNPELFLWDHCLYQTYPFINDDQNRCQCRAFVMDWDDLESSEEDRTQFQLTQDRLLSSLLENSLMLEKLSFTDSDQSPFEFVDSMFGSVHMKAFSWINKGMLGLDENIGQWSELEYLHLHPPNVNTFVPVFDQFQHLSSLQYLLFRAANFPDIGPLDPLCHLNRLQILHITGGSLLFSIPQCFGNLKEMRLLLLGISFGLTEIPISLFGLPNMKLLSLFQCSVSLDSLVAYNVPDGSEPNEWFKKNFMINDNTEYHLELSPLCEEPRGDVTALSKKLGDLISNSCEYPCTTGEGLKDTVCEPHLLNDGHCDWECNSANCRFDSGDCMMLCLAEELTECSWDLLLNEQCDEQCDNQYCSGHGVPGENIFTDKRQTKEINGALFAADLQRCPYVESGSDGGCQSASILSSYLDARIPNNTDIHCRTHWIGDGICDDSCLVSECRHDDADCEGSCVGLCRMVLIGWQLPGPLPTHKIGIDQYCTDVWPIASVVFNLQDDPRMQNCSAVFQSIDLNQDDAINIREFTIIASQIIDGSSVDKAMQVNCSSCVEPQTYNV